MVEMSEQYRTESTLDDIDLPAPHDATPFLSGGVTYIVRHDDRDHGRVKRIDLQDELVYVTLGQIDTYDGTWQAYSWSTRQRTRDLPDWKSAVRLLLEAPYPPPDEV